MLTIPIETKSKMPIYEQIYRYIRDDIISGSLPCGMKLPSGRGLASHLSVSRNTIDMAYGQLVAEGYIEPVPQKGYYVCKLDYLYAQKENLYNGGSAEGEQTGYGRENAVESKISYKVDFSLNGVDMDYFPYGTWRKLMRECLIDDNKDLFLSGDHQGDLELRQAVQSYLYQSRGVRCKPEQIIIGAGSDYMLLLLSRIFESKKHIAMENPTYKQAYTFFESLGYQISPVSVDEQGMRTELLEATGAELAYVTPAHHFPMGMVLSASRRQKLLAWAGGEEGRYIIEDDYDSEFRYAGKPIPALHSQDPFGKVIYIGTFSKAIAPGIRISYMVLPEKLLNRYHQVADFYFSTVSRIDQRLISRFLLQGDFERHLNRMRKIYKTKHDMLLQELRESGLPVEIAGSSAGLHFLLVVGGKTADAAEQEKRMVEAAAKEGIHIYALSDFYIREELRQPAVLLGYARLKEAEIKEGVLALRKAWESLFG